MEGNGQLDPSEREAEGTAVLHAMGQHTLLAQPFGDFIIADNGRASSSGNRYGIAHTGLPVRKGSMIMACPSDSIQRQEWPSQRSRVAMFVIPEVSGCKLVLKRMVANGARIGEGVAVFTTWGGL